MDILRKFCNAVPDGMTGNSLANALSLTFVEAIEKDLISADFIQNEIVDLHPSLVSCPTCDTFPTPPFVTAVFNLVSKLEPFLDMDTTRNMDGDEYSALVRNQIALMTGSFYVVRSIQQIWDALKITYPHYYRIFYDGADSLCKVDINENGEKMYSTISPSQM